MTSEQRPPATLDPRALAALAASDLSRLARLQVGVATSSFQTEGGLDGPGQPETNWAAWQRAGRVEPIGPACDLWGRFDQVAARLRAMRCHVFRCSFEWARLWPSRDAIDPDAALAYADRFAILRDAGIEPIVTLQHFTHPAWLGPDLWLDERSPDLFARYVTASVDAVQTALTRRGRAPISRWVTINELNMLALATYGAGVFPHGARSAAEGDPRGLGRALTALDHLAAAHVRAYDAVHAAHARRGWPTPDVTHNPNLLDVYTLGAQWIDAMRTGASRAADRARYLRARRARFARFMLDPDGPRSPRADVARALDDALSERLPLEAFPRCSELLSARRGKPASDARALDLYDPWTRQQARGGAALLDALSRGEWSRALVHATQADLALAEPWAWQCEPRMLERALLAVHDERDPTPIDVLENGMAHRRPAGERARGREDLVRRPDFIRGYALAMARAACVHGLPARTYAHWTLVDNYELGRWAPRFGLFARPDPSDAEALPWDTMDALGDDAAGALSRFARACEDPSEARAWVTTDR
jgi:beta-glucosidase